MGAPNYGSAALNEVLMLETYNKEIDLLQNVEMALDKRFSDIKTTDASLRNFRIGEQTEMGTQVSAFNSDGGAYSPGLGNSFDQGQMTPFEIIGGAAFTDLARRIGEGGSSVTIINPIERLMSDMTRKLSKKRNALLQGSNNGQLATVDAAYAGGGANPITLSVDPFGARLIDLHETVQVFDHTTNLVRTTCFVTNQQSLGIGTGDSITVDAVPAGTVAGDYIMQLGVASGTPLFFNGLQYIVSPSQTGEYLGQSRALSYVQSPALNANSAPLTLGTVQAFLTRMMQPLGMSTFESDRTKNFWYEHPAQWMAWVSLGFAEQQVMLVGGAGAKNFDGVSSPFGNKKMADIDVELDTVAAVSKVYFLDQSRLVRCRFSKAPQMVPGPIKGMYWPRIVGGAYTTENDVYMYDAVNYASRNNWANGVIYGLQIPGALKV